jgi:predicted O-methyltransferase YrrM
MKDIYIDMKKKNINKMNKELLMKEISELGSDNLDVFGGKYEGGIHLQQRLDEISDLIIYLIDKIDEVNFLEIGSASGGNVFVFNKYFNIKNIVIIDDNNHPKHKFRKNILKDIEYKEFIGDSKSDESINFIKNLDMEFDILFIDGDHSYNGVKLDTMNYLYYVKENGYVIFHDTITKACPGIKQWVSELKEGFFDELEYKETFYDTLGISVFQKIIRSR